MPGPDHDIDPVTPSVAPPSLPPTPSAAHAYLSAAARSGQLGPGPSEDIHHPSALRAFIVTLPWRLLLLQLLWSCLVLLVAYYLAVDVHGHLPTMGDSTAATFWTTRLNVPSSVVYGVGWALFVLLGFYIRDSTHRYHSTTTEILPVAKRARFLATNILYSCPPGTWHAGDVDRLIRHLVAYPIALKMQLHGERSSRDCRDQLDPVIHAKDTDDVLKSSVLHAQYSRVIRAYTLTVDDDTALWPSEFVSAEKKPMGYASLYVLLEGADRLDDAAQVAVGLSEFRSSTGYV